MIIRTPPAPTLILHFLSYVRAASVRAIGRYLAKAWQIRRGTTRTAIARLFRAGKIARVGRGRYALEAA